jgi:UDP-N-acetylmuramyl pentapeptide synthase
MFLVYSLSIGLTLLGALSPLLTLSALFQQKEWRMDRLREHLRHEGAIRQLWGTLRPFLAILLLLTDLGGIWMVTHATDRLDALNLLRTLIFFHIAWLTLFAGLTCVQFLMRKQRAPKWTAKAILITSLSLVLTTFITVITAPFLIGAPIILLVQPVVVWIAWGLLLPVDRFLKQRRFMQAAVLRDQLKNATVIGIAGSVGKTTVKELLKCVLQDLTPLVTPEHVNTEMGVAEWMLKQVAGYWLLVTGSNEKVKKPVMIVEMGAYRKGEIALMCTFVKPTIGVMTALGSDHLALFGSEKNIIEANGELIEALPKTGHAFFYGRNDGCRKLSEKAPCPVTLANEEIIKVTNIEEAENGLKFSLSSSTFSVALHGLHNGGNAWLAIAVARHLGIQDERIKELLKGFHPLSHTFNVRQEFGITVVDDTYNSSRLSVRAALDWAKNRPERPRILLMSGLLETGTEESRFLEELGTVAKDSVDRVIFTTDTNATSFEKGFKKTVDILQATTERAPSGSLLLALGRMPRSSIQKLLPL